jgi:restriction system protein
MNEHFWVFRVPQEEEILQKIQTQKLVAGGFGIEQSVADIADKEKLKNLYRSFRPHAKESQANAAIGQLYRVAHVIKNGDWILTPNKDKRTVLFGRVVGGYEYLPDVIGAGLRHARKVEWVGEFSRDSMSNGLRNSIGGLLTVLNMDKHANELLLLMGQQQKKTTDHAQDDETDVTPPFYEETKSKSEELIADQISRIDPYQFQELVAGLLEAMGYRTRVSDRGMDHGVDILAHPDALGFETPRIKVQVKHRQSTAGGADIRNLVGTLGEGEKGLFVSTGGFTTEAKSEARKTSRITILDAEEFVKLLIEHYENLDSDYKSIIPLRKLWVPAS